MLEMRVGLALGHGSPASRPEELVGESLDGGRAELARDRFDLIESLVVMSFDRLRAAAQVGERMTVGGRTTPGSPRPIASSTQ